MGFQHVVIAAALRDAETTISRLPRLPRFQHDVVVCDSGLYRTSYVFTAHYPVYGAILIIMCSTGKIVTRRYLFPEVRQKTEAGYKYCKIT